MFSPLLFSSPSHPSPLHTFLPVNNFPQAFLFIKLSSINHDLHLHLGGFSRLHKTLTVNHYLRSPDFHHCGGGNDGGQCSSGERPTLHTFPKAKGLFGKNGTLPPGDRFCRENRILSILKRKEKGRFVWGNGTEPLYPNRPLNLVEKV